MHPLPRRLGSEPDNGEYALLESGRGVQHLGYSQKEEQGLQWANNGVFQVSVMPLSWQHQQPGVDGAAVWVFPGGPEE